MALNAWQKITRVAPGKPFGDGSDGPISASSLPAQINMECSGTAASTALAVGLTTLQNNDIILIHQTRGTGVGQWEINRVVSGGGTGSLTLLVPLQYTYTNSGASQAQVIKIRQYTTVTVSGSWTPPSWDGSVGGIITFACKSLLTLTGELRAGSQSNGWLSRGFVGGGSVGRNSRGFAGEGTAGATHQSNTSANGDGGGAGDGGGDAGGGGGGSHATSGTSGATGSGGHAGGSPGNTVGTDSLINMNFGGAGGSGGGDEDGDASGRGGDGGGIIALFAKQITVTATGYLIANGGYGMDGTNPPGTGGMGGGGGGAGGSILILGQIISMNTNRVNLAGGYHGNGGGGRTVEDIGGNGGAGRIAIYYSATLSGSVSNYGSYYTEQDKTLVESGGSALMAFALR